MIKQVVVEQGIILRYFILSATLLAGAWSTVPVTAQEFSMPGYTCEGDDIVFNFDIRQYELATIDGTAQRLDFNDLNVYEVYVAGEFNNWSREGWRMVQVDSFNYQLRKRLAEFDDQFKWEFKFVVNGKYWAEPGEVVEQELAVHPDQFWRDVFNLHLFKVNPDPNGNTYFFLPGYSDARNVVLTGSFNGWDESYPLMEKVKGGWAMKIDLDPGYYEYKFIVDGNWLHDPGNPEAIENIHGTLNSILNIREAVRFELKSHLDAKKVTLTGSFLGWNSEGIDCVKKEDRWEVEIQLEKGKHYYKFIVDGAWIIDPANPFKEYDKAGNLNSVTFVR